MASSHLGLKRDQIQLNSTASKQHVVCALQRGDVTMLMTSLHCQPVTTVELSCVVGVTWP